MVAAGSNSYDCAYSSSSKRHLRQWAAVAAVDVTVTVVVPATVVAAAIVTVAAAVAAAPDATSAAKGEKERQFRMKKHIGLSEKNLTNFQFFGAQ